MTVNDPAVDDYLASSTQWPDEMRALRPIMLDAGLTEELKWRKPCYSHDGENVAIFQEMKSFLALMFFKGALLDDPHGLLEDQGPNSRSARRMTFTSVDEVDERQALIAEYLDRAIAVVDAGLEVEPAGEPELVDELRERLADDPELAAAFDALTPGRRREYHLHISGAKKSETRSSRVDKCAPKILEGKGLRDR